MDRRRRYLPPLAFAAVVLLASLVPVPEGGSEALPTLFGVALDKWVHAAGYGLLTVLLLRTRQRIDTTAVAAAVVVAAGYGGAIELLQWPLPTRGTSLLDAAANAVGAALAALVWFIAGRRDGASEQ